MATIPQIRAKQRVIAQDVIAQVSTKLAAGKASGQISASAAATATAAGAALLATANAATAASVEWSLPEVAGMADKIVAAARASTLRACSASPSLSYPPCWMSLRTVAPSSDTSDDARFYRQLDVIADYLAGKVAALGQDTIDRNGIDHVGLKNLGTGNPVVAAISDAISTYMLNFPYSSVQASGWKASLASILAMPIVTWDKKLSWYTFPGDSGSSYPTIMQNPSPGKWVVAPPYFPFFFWKGSISFLRFLRYDPTIGFYFTEAFAQVVNDSVTAWYQAAYAGVNISAYNSGALTDPDGFMAADPSDNWLSYSMNMPGKFTASIAAAGNAAYSHLAAETNAAIVQAVSIMLAFVTAGSSLAATGTLTIANGIALASAVNQLVGDTNPVIGDLLVAGKVLNLDAFCADSGLDMAPATEIQVPTAQIATVAAPDLTSIAPPAVDEIDVSDDSLDVDPSDLASIGDPVIDTSGLDGLGDSVDSVSAADISDQIFMQPPDVSVVDSATLTDLTDGTQGQAVNIAPSDPSTASASDTATTGTDTSAMDNSMSQAVSAATGSSGNFNLASYVAAAAKIYSATTAAIKAGTASPGTANHPAVGTSTLPNGYKRTVNADGSTTIYSPAGQAVETILPSGKIITGGPVGSNTTLLLAIAAAGVLAFMMLGKGKHA